VRNLFFGLVAIVSTAAGCSSGGDNNGGVADPAAFDAAVSKAFCAYNTRCGYYGASEEKKCESDAVAAAKTYTPVYSTADAVKMKRLSFDAAKAQACVDAIAKAGCSVDSYYALGDTCGVVFKGKVATGGMCLSGLECAAGNYCDQGNNTGTDGCSGTCKANLATGATCDPNDPHCNDSDFCDDTAMTCKTRLAAGADCKSGQCGLNNYCKGYDSGPPEVLGKCSGLGQVGDTCATSFIGTTNCSLGLWCNDVDPMNAACAKPVAAGGDCTSYYACVDGLDCIGLAFDQNTGAVTTHGKCAAWLDIGKACSSAGESGCPLDSTCDATANMCKAGAVVGDTCDPTSFGQCTGNAYCDGNTSKCATMVALGGACMPQPTDPQSGFPLGDEPCHDGTCDATTMKCALMCM
jgi:hypothetical protein